MKQLNLKINEPIAIKNKTASPNTLLPLNTNNNSTSLQGEVAYLGPVSFANGEDWVGVRLTGDSIGHGKNDGTVRGVRYFKRCGIKGGIFVRRERVRARTKEEVLFSLQRSIQCKEEENASLQQSLQSVNQIDDHDAHNVPEEDAKSAPIAAAIRGRCRRKKRVDKSETVEEKEQGSDDVKARDDKLRDINTTLDEAAEKRENQRLTNKETEMIFNRDDWKELNVGYTRNYYKMDYKGMCEGDELTEFVKMDKPRKCSYSSKTNWKGEVIETRILKAAPAHNSPSRKPGAECNGITPRQQRAVIAMITRRCVTE